MNSRQQELNSISDNKRAIEELVCYEVRDRIIVYNNGTKFEGYFDEILYKDLGEGEHYYLKISKIKDKESYYFRMEYIESMRENFDGMIITMKKREDTK